MAQDEKDWFTSFFGGQTLEYRSSADKGNGGYIFHAPYTVRLQSYSDGGVILGGDFNISAQKKAAFVFGTSNTYTEHASAFGFDNSSLGYNSIAIGEHNSALGSHGVAIGGESVTGSGGLALGLYAFSKDQSNALGMNATALGNKSTAIGLNAIAGKKEIIDYLENIYLGYNNQTYFVELQKRAPELFGTYTEETEYDEARFEEARTKIFELYKDYFQELGITSLDQLKAKYDSADIDPLLQTLGFQYYLTRNNIESAVAIGTDAHAMADNTLSLGTGSEALVAGSVGLGAFSRATEADMVADGTKAPFSNINLTTKGTAVNGLNEYLLGPVAIGGKKAGDETAVYLRQLKYVADGTADTDAVNLRQLKAAVGNGGNADGGDNNGGSGNSGSSIVYEAGDNIAITDKGADGHTKVISATGITDIKNQVTDLNGRVDKVEDSMNTMNHRITKLDRRVDKVGAGAAALAALHPLDFDPDNKWDIAGGYGHYAGQSAMALGAYYRPNEDVMFSIGGAFGNGEDMINAGVSVKVGSGESKTTTSKAAMAKKINELQQVVTTQHQQLEEQKANMAKQDAKIAAHENEIQELKAIMQQILAK